MPRGPKGEKRGAGVIECAHEVFQIAIGEEDEETMRKALGLESAVYLDEQAKREAELFG